MHEETERMGGASALLCGRIYADAQQDRLGVKRCSSYAICYFCLDVAHDARCRFLCGACFGRGGLEAGRKARPAVRP